MLPLQPIQHLLQKAILGYNAVSIKNVHRIWTGNRLGNSSGALRPKSLDVRKIAFEIRFLFLFNSLP